MAAIRHLSAFLLAWLAGAAGQLQQARLWSPEVYVCTGLAALGLFLTLRRFGPVLRLGMALCAVATVAWAWTGSLAGWRMQNLSMALEGQDLDVIGVVEAMPQRQDVGLRFRFRIEQASWRGEVVSVPPRIYLGWYEASSRDDPWPVSRQAVQAGERWRLRVRLKAAHGHINPRGFDYELWLWEQGIRATGYVRQGRADPAPERLGQTGLHPVEWMRQQVRDRMLARWHPGQPGQPSPNLAGVLAALVAGDQAAIEREDWDVFRATGVAHLVSISGLHVTMLGWLAGLAAAAIWRRSALWGSKAPLLWAAPVVGSCLGLVVALAYALFSGWGVPAQRTVWMLAVVTCLNLSARDWHWRQIWLLAAAVVVALDPWALLQVGFWMSFVAVGVLLASHRPKSVSQTPEAGPEEACSAGEAFPRDSLSTRLVHLWSIPHWLVRALGYLLGLLKEQTLISVALLPLSLLFFGQFSVVGLLANLLAIPWITLLVTPLALLGMLVPWCWDWAAWCLQPLSFYLSILARWSWASVSLPMPPWPLAVLGLLGALLLFLRGPLSWRVWGIPLMLPALLWQAPRPAPGDFELLAADVGQGNAVLIRTAQHALLYDAGPRYSPESDAGHRVLVPLLDQTRERLDLLVLSHRDQDHIGGAQAVLDMQPQAQLVSSLPPGHVLSLGREAVVCAAGRSWQWDGVRFELLHPQPAQVVAPQTSSNASSCVLKITGSAGTALLAGDIEAAQERLLLQQGLDAVDLLLVPHHGSKTSSTNEFLQALQPRLAVVQAGYRNRFGHPAGEVVERYRALSVPLVNSAQCGALHWKSQTPGQWQCQRALALRYWHHQVD